MIQTATGLSVDDAQAIGALSDAAVTERDIGAGRLSIRRRSCIGSSTGNVRICGSSCWSGTFGEIKRSDGRFEVKLRGPSEAL